MAVKKRGLGRGLDALLSSSAAATEPSPEETSDKALRELPLDLIQRGRYQPRTAAISIARPTPSTLRPAASRERSSPSCGRSSSAQAMKMATGNSMISTGDYWHTYF